MEISGIVGSMLWPKRESGVVEGIMLPWLECLALLGACYGQAVKVWRCWGHDTAMLGMSGIVGGML